jgi:glutamyl-tRNA synthetase
VDVIIEGMAWLGLDPDEGPFYQMQRMDRYKAVLAECRPPAGLPCYMSVAELDALRERQMASKEKPRYDGTWRPEPGKVLPPVPEGVQARAALQATRRAAWWPGTTRSRAASRSATTNSTTW